VVGSAPAPDPTQRQCDWCPNPGSIAIEQVNGRGRGLSIYIIACANHVEQAHKSLRKQPKEG
jgi:hypothetical protein